MLILLFSCFTALHLGGIGFLFYHWRKIEKPVSCPGKFPGDASTVSVVVVVRNEARHIGALLKDLNKQDFSREAYEVIVVDDHSSDDTVAIVGEVEKSLAFQLRLIKLQKGSGKKAGLAAGIAAAEGEFLLVTDGDCRLPVSWISSIYACFCERDAVFVSGPVTFSAEKGMFQKMQTVEFASLVGSGAALLKSGRPGMCNAANMAFRKEVFLEAGGFDSNFHIPSGDDEFLLQAIFGRYPKRVFYLKSPLAVVQTEAQHNFAAFYQQRKRWAGKWRLHRKPAVAFTALTVFVLYAAWLWLFAAMWAKGLLLYFFVAALLKFAAEFLFLRSVLQSFKKKWLWFPFIILQVIYPVYVLFFGLAVNFGSFTWKGRTYKYAEI